MSRCYYTTSELSFPLSDSLSLSSPPLLAEAAATGPAEAPAPATTLLRTRTHCLLRQQASGEGSAVHSAEEAAAAAKTPASSSSSSSSSSPSSPPPPFLRPFFGAGVEGWFAAIPPVAAVAAVAVVIGLAVVANGRLTAEVPPADGGGWTGTDLYTGPQLQLPDWATGIQPVVAAPRLTRKGNQLPAATPAPAPSADQPMQAAAAPLPPEAAAMLKAVAAVQAEMLKTSTWVGESFAEDARAMHYGEKDAAMIHGRASPKEVQSLIEEGVPVAPVLVPVVPPGEVN